MSLAQFCSTLTVRHHNHNWEKLKLWVNFVWSRTLYCESIPALCTVYLITINTPTVWQWKKLALPKPSFCQISDISWTNLRCAWKYWLSRSHLNLHFYFLVHKHTLSTIKHAKCGDTTIHKTLRKNQWKHSVKMASAWNCHIRWDSFHDLSKLPKSKYKQNLKYKWTKQKQL